MSPFLIDGVDYAYVATSERQNQIVSSFHGLEVGQDREKVREVLGLPDEARPGIRKETGRFTGWSYMYRIKMRGGGPNTNDVCVEVFFNKDGHLTWATPNNIGGLGDVGSPSIR